MRDVKKLVRLAFVGAVAVAVSGCIVSREDPQKPVLALPDALPAPAETTTSLPDPWWKIFGDARLDARGASGGQCLFGPPHDGVGAAVAFERAPQSQ